MMIFHEHGLPHRQYLSAVPSTHDYEQHMEILKREVRLKLRQDAEDGKDFRKRMCKWSEDFQVDTSWWTGITDTPAGFLGKCTYGHCSGGCLPDCP